MNRKTVIAMAVVAVVFAAAGFAGGYFLSRDAAAPDGARGAFAQLSQTERDQLATMSDEERQAFFEEKGIDMPAGGPMGGAGGGRGGAGMAGDGRGGAQVLEGTVAAIEGDKVSLTLTGGGTANVYVDDSTVLASTEGKAPELSAGANVVVISTPEAAGVNAASTVVVK